MRTPCAIALVLCAFAASLTLGCALLGKGDPGNARYFSLERSGDRSSAPASEAAPPPAQAPARLRLGHVTGLPYLEERLVFRDSSSEVGYYRERLWTEPPAQFLERLLSRVLFEQRGLAHVVGGAAPTLEVQLLAFEEILAPQHLARVRVLARLHDEQVVLFEETLTVDRPIDGDRPEALVEALGEALRSATEAIADAVVRQLAARPVAPTLP